MRVLLIGYGNPSRGDDGVGHYVAKEIRERAVRNISTLTLCQLGPELAETVKDYDLVVFVDAQVSQSAEGLSVVPVEAAYRPSAFTHVMSPASLLALTKALYQKEPQAFIVAVPGYDFDFGTGLCDETTKWAEAAIERILEMSRERE